MLSYSNVIKGPKGRALPATQGDLGFGWLRRGMLKQVSPKGDAEAGRDEHVSGCKQVPNRSACREVACIKSLCQTLQEGCIPKRQDGE